MFLTSCVQTCFVSPPPTGHASRFQDDRWTTRITSWRPYGRKRSQGRTAKSWMDEIETLWKDTIWQRVAQDLQIWKKLRLSRNDGTQQLNDDDDNDDDGDDELRTLWCSLCEAVYPLSYHLHLITVVVNLFTLIAPVALHSLIRLNPLMTQRERSVVGRNGGGEEREVFLRELER